MPLPVYMRLGDCYIGMVKTRVRVSQVFVVEDSYVSVEQRANSSELAVRSKTNSILRRVLMNQREHGEF